MKLYIAREENVVQHHRATQRHGDWSETCEFRVTGAYLNSTQRYGVQEFAPNFEAELGEFIYVLYITYSSGDSFGTANGKGEVLFVFKDPTVAYAAKRAVQEQDPKEPYQYELVDETGAVIKINNPCFGYFEHLTGVHVEDVLLKHTYET